MMKQLTLSPPRKPFDAQITPPGSKSLTNRSLLLACLAKGVSTLSNVLFADDTLVMMECLARLGFRLEVDRAGHVIHVHGQAGRIEQSSADLFCGNSGTSIRFLTALCALGRGRYNLDGVPRMRKRPIGELVDLLHHLGIRIDYLLEPGYPPINVIADGLPGGIVRFGGSKSSQFLSALLQVAPYARNEVQVDLDGPQTSWPYVAMTMRLMDSFGVTPELIRDPKTGDPRRIIIPHGHPYQATNYAIEPDASNATYFLAAAAISPGSKVTVLGLGKDSLQGDVGFSDVLRQMGASVTVARDSITVTGPDVLEGIEVDLSAMPDTAQTLAVAALFATGPTTIRGLHTLRVKETDRIAALATELSKLGATIDVEPDSLTVHPPDQLKPAAIDTYDDHRMAMSFALTAVRQGGLRINDPACVNKTYPNYFNDLATVSGVGMEEH
jgi:3-phosphoshikimate 1-carboxyvinyltransferase